MFPRNVFTQSVSRWCKRYTFSVGLDFTLVFFMWSSCGRSIRMSQPRPGKYGDQFAGDFAKGRRDGTLTNRCFIYSSFNLLEIAYVSRYRKKVTQASSMLLFYVTQYKQDITQDLRLDKRVPHIPPLAFFLTEVVHSQHSSQNYFVNYVGNGMYFPSICDHFKILQALFRSLTLVL